MQKLQGRGNKMDVYRAQKARGRAGYARRVNTGVGCTGRGTHVSLLGGRRPIGERAHRAHYLAHPVQFSSTFFHIFLQSTEGLVNAYRYKYNYCLHSLKLTQSPEIFSVSSLDPQVPVGRSSFYILARATGC